MKIKNILYLSSIIFACLTFLQANVAQTAVEFKDVFANNTPLQFSLKSMRNYFRSINASSAQIQGRKTTTQSKTSLFNQAFMSYIKDVYNRYGYGKILSQDGTHLIDFLEISNEINLDTTTVYVCLRLFYNKLKSAECEIIDDSVIRQLLKSLPPLLERHLIHDHKKNPSENLDFLRSHTEETMLDAFTDHFSDFQNQPDTFLANLANNITKHIQQEWAKVQRQQKKNSEDQEMKERLRNLVIRLFESVTNKLLWNYQSHESIWSSFIDIAHGLQLLGNHGIIDHMDDLDDLLWSLVHRFCWFLDLDGHALPLEFYDEAEADLSHNMVYFLEAPEQDEGIKTKKETLIDAFINAKAKAIATQQGLVQGY